MSLLVHASEAWAAARRDDDGVAAFARDVGARLIALSDEELRLLRNLVVRALPDGEHAKGLALGLVEVVDGYRTALAAAAAEQHAVAEALAGDIKSAVLAALREHEHTTSELARRLAKTDEEVSRALARLRDAELVESVKRVGGDGRLRWHRLSPRGERLVAEPRRAARPLPAKLTLARPVPRGRAGARPKSIGDALGSKS